MSLTFKDMQAYDVQNVILNENEFAETVSYLPAGGVARDIVVDCDETLTMQEGSSGLYSQGALRVLAKRDATYGIDSPAIGDSVTRTVGGVSQAFSYSGEISEVDETAWTLVFIRNIPFERR